MDKNTDFWSYVIKTDSCWPWLGALTHNGYGQYRYNGTNYRAHRFAYSLLNEIPNGLVLDHLCHNRCCVNPEHLEPVTQLENLERSNGFGVINRAKTHCLNGHEFTPNNLVANKNGWRVCKKCHNERVKSKYKSRKRLI